MRLILLVLTIFIVSGGYSYGSNVPVNNDPDSDSVWLPSKVDWQVVRAKKPKDNKDICIVRWIYDDSATLSFVESGEAYKFILNFKNLANAPKINTDEEYYGVLSKQDASVAQTVVEVINDKALRIIDTDAKSISAFRVSEKISIFFEDKIYTFPVANALENFDAYEQCRNTLDMPKKAVEKTLQAAAAPEKDMHERAQDHLDEIRDRATVPPKLPAFRMSNTKAEIMEKYRKMGNGDSGASGGMNQNLIRKLQILEMEKEELRRKLLTLTKESYLPGIIECKPPVGLENDDILTQSMKDSYISTIEKLRAENRSLQQAVDSCPDCL